MSNFNNLQENEAIATSDVKRCDADFAVITLGSTDGLNEALVALEDAIQSSVATTDWGSVTGKPTTLAGYGITDAVDGSGTANTLAKFTPDGNTIGDSKFYDNGTTQAINTAISAFTQLIAATTLPNGLIFNNNHTGTDATAAVVGNSIGINTGVSNTGVRGAAQNNPSINVGVSGTASGASANNIGLYGVATGGTNNYAAQLIDGTETVAGRFLKNITTDGKARWANITASDVTGVIKQDGATALSANWNAGSYTITSNKLVSTTDATANGLTIGRGAGNISSNTVVGSGGLSSNSSGYENTALGTNTLATNATGSDNTALGASSMYYNQTGSTNTAVGAFSLRNNTTGSNNTAIGYTALDNNTTSSANVAVGYKSAVALNSGGNNVSLGTQAAEFVTTATNNVFIGHGAGRYLNDGSTSNTSPTTSVLIGANAMAYTASDTNQIVIGNDAKGNGSNTTTIGNTSTTITHLHGNLSLKNATAVTTAAVTQTKHVPIVINGVTYKLLLAD